ncbi:MAG: hypothetical protein GXP27_06855 [Planctomycetes bacterium]|nr:hypothetical protein [Planctomycetota bacterium]
MRFQRLSSLTALLTALCIQLLCSTALAADAAKSPPQKKPADSGKAPIDAPSGRTVYVPYKDLKAVFEKPGAGVFLPYAEYLRLWRKATRAEGEKPPLSAVIRSAQYTARVEGDFARVTGDWTVDVLQDPWAELPIQFGEAAVGKVECKSGEMVFYATGSGRYAMLFSGGTGPRMVHVELSCRVASTPNGRRFELTVPPAATATLELIVPQGKQRIELSPAGVPLESEVGEKQSRLKVRLGATPRIVATWHPVEGAAPKRELLARASNRLQVGIEGDLIHWHAVLAYQVLRGQLAQARFAVPATARVLDVSSPTAKIKNWNVEKAENGNRRVVQVDFFEPVKDSVTVQVDAEQPLPEGPVRIAGLDDGQAFGIHALGVVHEDGHVVVIPSRELTLTIEKQQGLIRIEEKDVSGVMRRPGMLAFRYFSSRVNLSVLPAPIQPRVTVVHRGRYVFGQNDLRVTAELEYTIEKAGVFEVRLKVPNDLVVDGVSGPAVKSHAIDEAAKRLTVSFREKQIGKTTVVVVAHRPVPTQTSGQELLLPLLEPLDVTRETGRITLYAPEAIDVFTDPEKLRGAEPAPPEGAIPMARLRVAASWTFARRPVEIPVRTRRKPTRLTAFVGTVVDVRQELTRVTTQVRYDVQYAPVDTFRLAVPEAIADRVEIQSTAKAGAAAIRQKTRAEKAEDGWVTWTVQLQRPVVGRQQFEVSYDLVSQDGEKPAAEFVIRPVRPFGLEPGPGRPEAIPLVHVTGEIVVRKEATLSVSARPATEALEPIDLRELTGLAQQGALAYRYFLQPVTLKLTRAKLETQKVVQTVVSRALIEIVVSGDQQALYRCRYRLRSSERQRLAIDLPGGLELLGVLVDGKRADMERPQDDAGGEPPEGVAGGAPPDAEAASGEIERPPEAGWERYLINVARAKSSDEPFTLTLQFRTALSEAFEAGRGQLELPLPRLGGQTASAVVQQTRLALWVPPRVALVGSPEEFTLEQPPFVLAALGIAWREPSVDLERWIEAPPLTMVDFPTFGRAYRYRSLSSPDRFSTGWWNVRFHTGVWTLALVFVAWVLRKTSWENKLALLLLAAVALLMYGLTDLQAAAQWLTVARFGLVAMLGLWLIHGVLGARRTAEPQTKPPQPDSAAEPQPPVEPEASAESQPPAEPSPGAEEPQRPSAEEPPSSEPESGPQQKDTLSGDEPQPNLDASEGETAGEDDSQNQPEKE